MSAPTRWRPGRSVCRTSGCTPAKSTLLHLEERVLSDKSEAAAYLQLRDGFRKDTAVCDHQRAFRFNCRRVSAGGKAPYRLSTPLGFPQPLVTGQTLLGLDRHTRQGRSEAEERAALVPGLDQVQHLDERGRALSASPAKPLQLPVVGLAGPGNSGQLPAIKLHSQPLGGTRDTLVRHFWPLHARPCWWVGLGVQCVGCAEHGTP